MNDSRGPARCGDAAPRRVTAGPQLRRRLGMRAKTALMPRIVSPTPRPKPPAIAKTPTTVSMVSRSPRGDVACCRRGGVQASCQPTYAASRADAQGQMPPIPAGRRGPDATTAVSPVTQEASRLLETVGRPCPPRQNSSLVFRRPPRDADDNARHGAKAASRTAGGATQPRETKVDRAETPRRLRLPLRSSDAGHARVRRRRAASRRCGSVDAPHEPPSPSTDTWRLPLQNENAGAPRDGRAPAPTFSRSGEETRRPACISHRGRDEMERLCCRSAVLGPESPET